MTITAYHLPSREDCRTAVKQGTATRLQNFIYLYDRPALIGQSVFREGLSLVLQENKGLLKKRIAELEAKIDFICNLMTYECAGHHEGWCISAVLPGDDPESAIDKAMKEKQA